MISCKNIQFLKGTHIYDIVEFIKEGKTNNTQINEIEWAIKNFGSDFFKSLQKILDSVKFY